MSFRCEITGKQAPPNTKPIVITYQIRREYHGETQIYHGYEVVKEVHCLPEVAPTPDNRLITVEGVRR